MGSLRCIVSLLPLMFVIVVGRELRPSEHGLDYESSSSIGEELAPEMKEFFRSAPNSKSSSSMALPRTMNSNDTAWWNDVSADKAGGDRLKHVLLVASLFFGALGAALVAVSGVIYFRRHNKVPNQIIDSKAIVITK